MLFLYFKYNIKVTLQFVFNTFNHNDEIIKYFHNVSLNENIINDNILSSIKFITGIYCIVMIFL